MRIRFAIVSSDLLSQVRTDVDILLRAVNAGDMDGVDAATEHLLELTVNCRSIDLSEDEWRTFLNEIRAKNPAFESRYLLPGEVCAHLFPTITAGDYVLELPIDGDMGEEEVDV
ncbi:hypothetical protein [Methylomonas methanica]|uniref:Uncharacterized protein n=1 Tax=Methylomonas methanica (strain DSM 25384 / MC09) TaxID=857087 RepID=F9ZVA2_METMM|nr:hypothetical protein [Methylomonas methanica]AEG00712.1 hypothetical protein Metme_2309 [Methylomonas methanica MC09]